MKCDRHVILLGDSIFDNAAYTGGGPDVVSQLRRILPSGWRTTLRAVDGARTDDVASQLRRLPGDASHLVLSVGGNDALAHGDLLEGPAASAAQVLGFGCGLPVRAALPVIDPAAAAAQAAAHAVYDLQRQLS
jgi:hypothetical protein